MSENDWKEVRLRYVVELNPSVPTQIRRASDAEVSFLPMEAIGENGSFDATSTRRVEDVLAGYSYFENGDIAYAKVTPCFENGKAAILDGLIGQVGFGTTEVTVVRTKDAVDTKFLFYVLIEDRFKQLGKAEMTGAGGLKRVPESFTRNFKVMLPSLAEQRAIASYLERETAEIDAFIGDQEELIELLNERRAATITQAITRGLDVTVQMKDSGVEWVGKVPQAWAVTRLTRYFDVVLGKMLDAGKEAHPAATLLPYIRAANIQDTGLDLFDVKFMPFTAAEAANLSIRSGDLLVVEGGSIGTSHLVRETMEAWSFQKTVNRVRSRGEALTSFLQYVIRSYRDSSVLGTLCNGSTIAHLTAEKLLNLVVPMPSPDEQQQIVDYLDYETAEIDAAIADAKEAIELSKERRRALISAAVTGRIDVRNHITAELGAA